MFKLNKKAVSELTTFVFLTLIIVLTSSTVYFFSKGFLDNSLEKIDRDNFEIYLKKMDYKINSIENFQGATTSFPISFTKGDLVFKDNQIYYQSLIEFDSSDYCFEDLCYESREGFERITINLSNNFMFNENTTFIGGEYILIFNSIKNESKISVSFK